VAAEGRRVRGSLEAHHRPIPKQRLRNARAMRHIATDAEKKLWRLLRSRQLEAFKFRRQVPIGRYIADFVCHEQQLIVEVDGGQHSESAKDQERDRWLSEAGYRVVRYWNNDVLKNPHGVLESILAELQFTSRK
jgi:very-short-patch-repair endonuclease